MGEKTKFGGAMNELGSNAKNPGPGQYQSNGFQKSVAYSFGGKTASYLDKSKNGAIPGPGQYNIAGRPLSASSSNRGGFGTERR